MNFEKFYFLTKQVIRLKPIYVIGHKNPDVDSIAAAIAYKVYKQSCDEGLYIAAAAGELNEECQ